MNSTNHSRSTLTQGNRPGNVVSPSLAPALLEAGRALVGLAGRGALTRAQRVLQASPAAAAQLVSASACGFVCVSCGCVWLCVSVCVCVCVCVCMCLLVSCVLAWAQPSGVRNKHFTTNASVNA